MVYPVFRTLQIVNSSSQALLDFYKSCLYLTLLAQSLVLKRTVHTVSFQGFQKQWPPSHFMGSLLTHQQTKQLKNQHISPPIRHTRGLWESLPYGPHLTSWVPLQTYLDYLGVGSENLHFKRAAKDPVFY